MYLRNEATAVILWLFTLGLIGITSLLLVQTRITWKRLREEASWEHKATFIVFLILTVPFALGATCYTVLMILLTLGIVE